MSIDRSLVSGSTAMLLLRLLEDKDMYGYEMIETLEQKSNNVFTLKAGTLYPLLHSLEEKNYLTSYESPANGKLRKYYSITKEGRNIRLRCSMYCGWGWHDGKTTENAL